MECSCCGQDRDPAAVSALVTPIEDEPWGMRELTLTDPSGNNLRVGRNVADP